MQCYNDSMLKAYFKPDAIKKRIHEIDLVDLVKRFDLVVLDVDNTLAIKGTIQINLETDHWLRMLSELDVHVLICSNNPTRAAKTIAEVYHFDWLNLALKPFKFRFQRKLMQMGIHYQKGVWLGDQLFTDIWLGKRLGFHTILIEPLSTNDYLSTRILRSIEKKVIG